MDEVATVNIQNIDSCKRIEDRFSAAVNVIRGLPKNGSYQPSNDMMLRFYSYFKQATLGPCTQKKPPFWDVVGRAKYESYKSLGKMPKERAMELYVDELKKIIETMSFTDNVAEFMGSINELDGVDVDDLEAVAPDAIKKVKSQPNSPFVSRESSPIRASDKPYRYHNDLENGHSSVNNNQNGHENGNGNHLQNGHLSATDHSDDEYIDTVEDDPQTMEEPAVRYSRPWTRRSRVSQSDETTEHGRALAVGAHQPAASPSIGHVLKMVESMRSDLQQINSRINLIENSLTAVRNQQLRKKILELKNPTWWPFADISPTWFLLMILWPFLAARIMQSIQRKK